MLKLSLVSGHTNPDSKIERSSKGSRTRRPPERLGPSSYLSPVPLAPSTRASSPVSSVDVAFASTTRFRSVRSAFEAAFYSDSLLAPHASKRKLPMTSFPIGAKLARARARASCVRWSLFRAQKQFRRKPENRRCEQQTVRDT